MVMQTFLDTIPGEYEMAKTKALCAIEKGLKSSSCSIDGVTTLA